MKDKMGIIVGIGITILVIFTLLLYLVEKNTLELFDIISIPIILIIILTASYIVMDRLKNIKKGLPVADERLKIVGYKAGYYGFISAIWSAVGSNMLSIILFDAELRGGLVVAAVVLVSGMVFMMSYFYFNMQGRVE